MTTAAYVSSITTPGGTYEFPFDDHQWEISMGFEALVQPWRVPAEIAAQVLDDLGSATGADREVTLTFGDPDNLTVVERVVVVGIAPADNIQRRRLLFSNVLWYFSRAWLELDWNPRRRVGDSRIVGSDLLTDETPVDDIAYAPWGINNGSAFTWTSLKDQVVAVLAAGGNGRPPVTFVTDDLSVTIDDEIVQEGSGSAPGTVVLAQAIESVPGASCFVDRTGVVHVCDALPGAEADTIEALSPDLWGHGSIVFVDQSSLRPSGDTAWRVLVDYECEVRFTHNATSFGLWAYDPGEDTFADNGGDVTRWPLLFPVLQVTDASLEVPDSYWGSARTVGQGTWLIQDEAFAAWGSVDLAGFGTLPQLTDDIVRKHWFGDSLQRYTIGGGIETFDPVWGGRINELMRCYRKFFKVNPAFWDRVRHVWPTRAAIWDPKTGTRAPSPVYCNYNVMPLDHFVAANITLFGTNVDTSYPDEPDSPFLGDANPSGFHVRIVDEELGIIAIERDISKFPGHSRIAVSPTTGEVETTGDAGLNEAVLQELIPTTAEEEEDEAWKLAVILSCSPASPNDTGRLYMIPVSMTDAADTAGLDEGVNTAGYAPDIETRSRLADARIAWMDDDEDPSLDNPDVATEIMSLFGVDDSGGEISADSPPDLVPINLEQELQPLAKAIAAADLLTKLDHYEGELAVPANQDLVPIGSLTRVVHRLLVHDGIGRWVTVLHCTSRPPHFSFEDFLQGTSRSFLLKEIASAR